MCFMCIYSRSLSVSGVQNRVFWLTLSLFSGTVEAKEVSKYHTCTILESDRALEIVTFAIFGVLGYQEAYIFRGFSGLSCAMSFSRFTCLFPP